MHEQGIASYVDVSAMLTHGFHRQEKGDDANLVILKMIHRVLTYDLVVHIMLDVGFEKQGALEVDF